MVGADRKRSRGGTFGTNKKKTAGEKEKQRRWEKRIKKEMRAMTEICLQLLKPFFFFYKITHTCNVRFSIPWWLSGKVIVLQDHRETKARFWKAKINTC